MSKLLKCPKCNKRKLRNWGNSMKISHYRCTACETEVQRKPTKVQVRSLRSLFKSKPRADIHRVWHAFCAKFQPSVRTGKFYKIFKKKVPICTHDWKWTGYDLMERVARWAKKFPNDIQIVRCDDDHHAGSDLVLIQHRKQCSGQDQYFGTTVVFIPQCTGEKPIRFFLYPSHHDGLIDALKAIKARNRKRWNSW